MNSIAESRLELLTRNQDLPAALDLARFVQSAYPKTMTYALELAALEAKQGNLEDAKSLINGMTIPFNITCVLEQYDVAMEIKSQSMLDYADWFYAKMDPGNSMMAIVNPHREAAVSAIKATGNAAAVPST
jgi:ADP-dependent phosphofructokinase/glucokinase